MRKMIKPKNKVFCRGCNKEKMLFETKKSADNFLKFNRDYFLETTGKAPNHSYYCRFCLGYHVTSNSNNPDKRRILAERDKKEIDKLIDAVKRNKEYLRNKDLTRKKKNKKE